MASISMSREHAWVVSRRGFAILLDRAKEHAAEDAVLIERFEAAKALDGLHLESIPADERMRIVCTLARSVDSLLTEFAIHSSDQWITSYVELLGQLRQMLSEYRPPG